jgi:hypothetical protein
MTAAAPPLAPDVAAGLRRLKLAAMGQLAPQLLTRTGPARRVPWSPGMLRAGEHR